MAQSVGHLTLVFGSGHDLTGHGMEPQIRVSTQKRVRNSFSPFEDVNGSDYLLHWILLGEANERTR